MTRADSFLESLPENEKAASDQIAHSSEKHFRDHCQQVWKRTDRMFAGLLVAQWLAGIGIALWVTPLTWIGATSSVHLHLLAAIFLGGAIVSYPIFLFLRVRVTRLHVMSSQSRKCWPPHFSFTSLEDGSKLISTSLVRWRFWPFIATGVCFWLSACRSRF